MLKLRALHANVDRLGLRASQLRFALRHVDLARHAGVVAVARHVE